MTTIHTTEDPQLDPSRARMRAMFRLSNAMEATRDNLGEHQDEYDVEAIAQELLTLTPSVYFDDMGAGFWDIADKYRISWES